MDGDERSLHGRYSSAPASIGGLPSANPPQQAPPARLRFSPRGRHRGQLRERRHRPLRRGAGRRRLLGRLVRPVPDADARAGEGGRGPRARRRAGQDRRGREPDARQRVRRAGHPGGEGVPQRPGRERVRGRAVAAVGRRLPGRADAAERGRAAARGPARERGGAGARGGDRRGRLRARARERAGRDRRRAAGASRPPRQVSLAIFDELGPEHETTLAYRRRLAALLF